MRKPCRSNKSFYLIAAFFLFFASFSHSAVDTIPRNKVYSPRLPVYIGQIGHAEDDIMIASHIVDGNEILILDFSYLDEMLVFPDSSLLASIPRSEATKFKEWRRLGFAKQGDFIFFSDGNLVQIYDVSNLKKPVKKHSFDVGRPVHKIVLLSDTIVVTSTWAQNKEPCFWMYKYDYDASAKLLFSNNKMGNGTTPYFTDKYLIYASGPRFYILERPLTTDSKRWTIMVPEGRSNGDLVIRDDYVFATGGLGTMVFDISDAEKVKVIDTLPDGFGDHIMISKNLLITGAEGPDQDINIFDISDPARPKTVAFWGIITYSMGIDPVRGLLYSILGNRRWMDGINLIPYYKEPERYLSLVRPVGGEKWERGSVQNITWNSKGYIDDVVITYIAGGDTVYISRGAPNNGHFSWQVPDKAMPSVKIRISDQRKTVSSESKPVSIKAPTASAPTAAAKPSTVILDYPGARPPARLKIKDGHVSHVEIIALDGSRLAALPIRNGTARWPSRKALKPGVYFLRAGNEVVKAPVF